ncbi:MAG: YidC/Oxa1 family membrane protein insertase [Arcobacter sp.]|jgi:YidC/Oxa1 family membrane protein insertase|uniref:YidC/Oxa1 family membrane protein insertase n=1 Tax=Arcobacter sp. TaxID=1872629 RepID=UPI001690EBEF|nr:YidC/Oxa1 family membrane protein insertase [Arcobacter sp.]MDY0302914.1 YidC/Oxa1 family membrane protein insertase [Candidatus Moranbacteria bacterium]MDY3205959.1 YidC/Oxa1 family membrane protein insertase [Arcobacter sp.]NLC31547.1 membrane protein insertase YidC [Candidatus Moranbacteria bacterium]
MTTIFHELIYQPIYNILIFVYDFFPGGDFGVAIIIVTVLLKAAMIPLSKKQIESQKRIQEIQPELKAIQEKYKNDKEKQTKEVMEFYKKNKVNPFSGCFPIIVQIIFLIAIYRVIINISDAGLVVNNGDLYSFVRNPGEINKTFLGVVDLLKPSIPIAILAAAAQFWQTKMMMFNKKKKEELSGGKNKKEENKEPDFAEIMNKQMLFFGPLLTLFIGAKFAAGLSIYWLFSTLFSVFQQIYILKKK